MAECLPTLHALPDQSPTGAVRASKDTQGMIDEAQEGLRFRKQ